MGTKHVLMVEDDRANVCGTIALLENAGIEVDVAETLVEAERELQKKRYQLLLLDWTLPKSPGGPNDTDAGAKLIRALKSGKLGSLNKRIRYFTITKQTDQFANQIDKRKAHLGILSKLDALAIVDSVVKALTSEQKT